MFKVLRSYSKNAKRTHETSSHTNGEAHGGGNYAIQDGAFHNGVSHGGGHLMEHREGGSSHRMERSGGRGREGFSESSSYEAREHFERKVQRVKKTRSERERERSRSLRRGDELEALDGGSARDALLQWARRATEGYPRVNVTNFSSSWRDGLAFNAILHRYRPKAINWDQISDPSVSNRDRLENAFNVAKREFDVDRLIDPEDVDTDHPDEKSIITYVSHLYEKLPSMPELSKLTQLQSDYVHEAREWRRWVERAVALVDDRLLIGSPDTLLLELERFRDEDMPPRHSDLGRLVEIHRELADRLTPGTEVAPIELRPPEMKRLWNELVDSVERRFALLRERLHTQGSLSDLISRLTRGIGITNEKLDLILIRIEDVEAEVEKGGRPSEIERKINEIVDDLNALESPINGFFDDVETLKQHNHPEANSFYKQVYGLHQRRQAYLERLTNQLLVRLGLITETMSKKQFEQSEALRKSRFGRLEECIEWVRTHMERLVSMEFTESLEVLEEMFERHKVDNRNIQDFRQEVDGCIARQAEISAEDSVEYYELLKILESEYQQLRDLSAGRMLDLDSLIAFVRAAQMELTWVHEREDIEVHRNWSDIDRLDLPMLTNYYKQILHEMELREPQYNDVHNRGAALLNQGHPATQVIEVYIQTLKKQWDWLLNLSRCLEQHLRDALALNNFREEAADAEAWIKENFDFLEKNYNRTDFSLEEGERMLRELDEMKEILNKYQSVITALTEKARHISPLWQRGEHIRQPILVTALCDYEDGHVNIRAGDDITLIDNDNLIKWKIQDVTGKQGEVPSVVFRIPPLDTRLTDWLKRLIAQFEKLRKLWDTKHKMIRYYMVLNTMKTIQGWDVNFFNSLDPEQRDAIIKALQEDTHKLLSEMDPNDPLGQRLRDELKRTMDHFWSLFNQAQRQPQEDLSNEFDRMLQELLRKLEEAWRALKERNGRPIPRTQEDLDRALKEQRQFEEMLQALDGEFNNLKELFSQLENPSPTQRQLMERVNVLWDDSWDLSRMYVERMKVNDAVIAGIVEVKDIVKAHEVTLNSFDDLPAALDRLRGEHAQLLELNMVLQQQQTVIDQLNRNVALLRQHVTRTRIDTSSHPDVDRLEEEVQQLNVRWENVQAQVAERLKATERALQVQMVYRSEYENEMEWLDRVEETINTLRRPDDLKPEQYQQQLDLLIAEYSQLQERTEAIENVNREGGKFIREAKGYDGRLKQYGDVITGIHGRDVSREFRRSHPQPKNGAQIVTEELEALNRRFAQLSSLILEKRNVMQVLIQNWKRQKQEEDDRRRAEEEEKRRAFEAARRKALEDADRLRREREEAERKRLTDNEKRKKEAEDAERKRREEEERRRREREEEERRRREEEERRRREDEERRRREEEDRRRQRDEDDRRRREEEEKRRKMPEPKMPTQMTTVTGEEGYDEFEDFKELPDKAKITEHEDEMQMFQEETVTKTQFYEMEGNLKKQTGEILTFVEGIRQGLIDLRSGGGQFFDIKTGGRCSLEEAAKHLGIDFGEILQKKFGIHHPETKQPLTLLEAIQCNLYDSDSRMIRDLRTGKALGSEECSAQGILTYSDFLKLSKQHLLKQPPLGLSDALSKELVDASTGQFTGAYSKEKLAFKDALHQEYVHLMPDDYTPSFLLPLSDVIRDGFINANDGTFEDRNSEDSFKFRDAVSKADTLINLNVPEIMNTKEEKKITLAKAITGGVINQNDVRFKDLRTSHGQGISLKDAAEDGLISKPMTLTEAHEKGLINSSGHILDRGTKRTMTLLEAVAAGVLDSEARHIVDTEEKDLISIAVALERGLLTPEGRIHLVRQQTELTMAEAVKEGLLARRARHTIFDVKGIRNTLNDMLMSVNEAIEAGAINLQAERVVDLGTHSSYSFGDAMAAKRIVDELLLQQLVRPVGIKGERGEGNLSLLRALSKGLIDPVKGCFFNPATKQELSVKDAYREGMITLRGAILVGGLFDVHPSLVAPVKHIDRKKRISRPGQEVVSDDRVKVTLADAMKQGLVDSRSMRLKTDKYNVTLEEAIAQGLLDPSEEWIEPARGGTAAGPTIEEKVSESVTQTGQQLAPKFYPDRNIDESITTTKRVRTTETTALGGPGGVSVYRAIAGGKGSIEAPTNGFHLYEAERKGIVDLDSGAISVPNVDRPITFGEGIELGVLEAGSISVVDPSTRRSIGVKEAIEKGVMDKNGRVGGQSLERAIDSKAVIVDAEPLVPTNGKKVIHFTSGTDQVISFRPVGHPVVEEFEQEWEFDATKGVFVDLASGETMNLDRALATGKLAPEDLHVEDAATGRKMSFVEAEKWGIIDTREKYYMDKRDNKRMSYSAAARDHRIYPTGGVAENAADAVSTKVKMQTRSFVTKKEALAGGQPLGAGHTLASSISSGAFNPRTGRFAFPGAEKEVTLKEAIIKGIFNPYDTTVKDRKANRDLSLLEALQEKIVDDVAGTVRDTQTGQDVDLATAINSGLIKSRSVLDQLEFRPPAPQPAITGGESHSSRMVEHRLQHTPFAPSHSHSNGSSAVVFRGGATRTGDGRHELVDIGGGKQAQFKVVRGDDGRELGEYFDKDSGMKYTINVGGDPYVTETKTTVKSTQQVQSVELEPHAEFVGIDKIRDKRNNRVMSLDEAKRLGLAKVDRKGKQQTKSYSVFRSNIQNAVLKGVVDQNGDKISLEEAVKGRVIDLHKMEYQNPRTGEAVSLQQAANMGLLDVTLSETLPAGVINPANNEKIPISRAISQGIIDGRTGEVRNPYTKERLTWIDLLRPVFNALTSEGVYDPTKGYGVPVTSALNDGLIAHGRYHNPITGEYVALEEACSRGLIDKDTYSTITRPFLADPSTGEQLNLIQAVEKKLIDPKARTIQFNRNSSVSIAKAIHDGRIPQDIGAKLRRVDKLTFPEALGKGVLNLVNNTYTDPDTGRQMTIDQAIGEGFLDAGSAHAADADEKNLSRVVESEQFDEASGRIRDKATGLNLTFGQAIERDVVDGDSLLHDLDSGNTLTLREALSRGRIDQAGNYVDSRTGAKMKLRQAAEKGLVALIASPMQAAQAVTEAVKRREKEGYKFKIEPFPSADDSSHRHSAPRVREESTTYSISTPHREPGLSVRMRTSEVGSSSLPRDRATSVMEDPSALADAQEDFLLRLENDFHFDVDDRVLENPETHERVSVRAATESGLLDVLTGLIVHPSTGNTYNIPKAVHMKMINADHARKLLEALGVASDDIASSLDRPGSRTSFVGTSSFPRPGSGMGSYRETTTSTSYGTPAAPSDTGSRTWTKTVSWQGKPEELRRSGGDLDKWTSYASTGGQAEMPEDAPSWARRH